MADKIKKSENGLPMNRNELGKTLIRAAVLLGIAILGGLAMLDDFVDFGVGEAPASMAAAADAANQAQAWNMNVGVPNGQLF